VRVNEWLEARNILAVRLDNIGDVIMLGPALRAVKSTSPHARITLLASPAGTTGAPLLPWVDDVLTWRAVWQDLGHLAFEPEREMNLIHTLEAGAFDAALIFTSFSQNPHAPAYACYLAGIPLRAGESMEFGGTTLTTELRGAPDEMHQAERNLRLVEHLGFPVADRDLQISIPDEARRAVPEILGDVGIDAEQSFVIVHPGASATSRRYPATRFADVANLLHEDGHQVLVPGTEREAEMLGVIQRNAPDAHYLVGETSVAEYAALVEHAALVICNDSLPMHLADAVRAPVLVLYSGTDLESQWRPRATRHILLRQPTECYPCYRFDCPIGLPCLDFSPEQVVDAARQLLRTVSAVHGQSVGARA
jgi:ADP-heptose:LPS heptosyltransferase